MELGSLPDWISSIANIGVAGAAVVAALAGIQSLGTWRRETVGRRRIELAEDVIADFHEARDLLHWVRSPASYSHEGKDRPGRDGEAPDVQKVRDTYHVQLERLTKQSEFFARMNARKYRVIAAFGEEAAGPYEAIEEMRSQIIIAAKSIMWALEGTSSDWEREMLPKWRAVIWEGAGGTDELKAKVEDAVAEVERRFRKEIADASKDQS